jgi:hypothetical protein
MADEIKKASTVIPTPAPEGSKVTQTTDTSVKSNIISQAEAKQQGEKRAVTISPEKVDPSYRYEITEGTHHVTVVPQQGLNYNYYAECSCAWEGRYIHQDIAEAGAQQHIEAHFPRRG